MVPEQLAQYLGAFERLAVQPTNRWDGFDLSAPDAPACSLQSQVAFVGLAVASLAGHQAATPRERERGLAALAQLIDRLIQRRVWSAWGAAAEGAARLPDPVGEGGAGYAGQLGQLLGLYSMLGGDARYSEPFVLHWSSAFRFSYTWPTLVATVGRQALARPDGAVDSAPDRAYPHDMAHLLWALRLGGPAAPYTEAAQRWLATLSGPLLRRGLRMPGAGLLAPAYDTYRKRALPGGDQLGEAWALALSAPLAPAQIRPLAGEHWKTLLRRTTAAAPLTLAMSYLLAVELGDTAIAAQLHTALIDRLGGGAGDTYFEEAPAAPWLNALVAIGAAGGLGRLLAPAPAPSTVAG